MVPFEALHIAQIQKTKSKALVAVVVRQFHQPICDHFIFRIELTFVAVTRLTDPEGLASQPNTYRALLLHERPYLCVEMASPLVFEGLRYDFSFELLLKIRLLKPPVFFFKLLHARHHRDIHAAILGPPLVEGCRTEKWLRMLGQSFLRINKVTALRFQAAIAAPVLLK